MSFAAPRESFESLMELGLRHLERVVAIDSQSDERSETLPSTEGQGVIVRDLQRFFADLGLAGALDPAQNLVVQLPATAGLEARPPLALMVHIDTARGTRAVPKLDVVPAWDGQPIRFRENDRLVVSAAGYESTRCFVGEDVIHGPGVRAFGLDDKLGTAEIMTLATVLVSNPTIPHGPLVLVFRPDEEIGRMAAVVGLAETLHDLGVRYGYTVDGILPFEVNVSNFNASHGLITVPDDATRRSFERGLELRIEGAKSHGATAKAEGYLNATTLLVRALAALGDDPQVAPLTFETDPLAEVNATVLFGLDGAEAESRLLAALAAEVGPHRWRGAGIEVLSHHGAAHGGNAVERALELVRWHNENAPFEPVLSETSEGAEGYSNPYGIRTDGETAIISFRLRDFHVPTLRAREAHVRRTAGHFGLPLDAARIAMQYEDMGPSLAPFPELVEWPRAAAAAMGQTVTVGPIRGGTGVDPFTARGIPVANVGTGYFAPESEKELTSRQTLARHALWLVNLVQAVAATSAGQHA